MISLTFKPALILALALGLGACTNPNRLGGSEAGADPNALGANGIDQSTLDPANDPNSPAFFQQKVGDRVLFAVDQSSLTADGKVTLDGQANWLTQNPGFAAIIEGHADEQGTREYNLALGARRANAVQEYLVSRGVAGSRLRTVTYGKERPIEVCSTEVCYAKNRRSVTVLSASAGS